MSGVASQSSIVLNPSLKRGQIDIDPDKAWKDGLRRRIEGGLQSMVDDAKKACDEELLKLTSDDASRVHLLREYDEAMSNIRGLAEEQFRIELERERQERRWLNGQAMLPEWDHALKSEQQEIMDRIKDIKKDDTSPASGSHLDMDSSLTLVPAGHPQERQEMSPRTGGHQKPMQSSSVQEVRENQLDPFTRPFKPPEDIALKSGRPIVTESLKEIAKDSVSLATTPRSVVVFPSSSEARLTEEHKSKISYGSPERRPSIRKLSVTSSLGAEHQPRMPFECSTPPQWNPQWISPQQEKLDRPKDTQKGFTRPTSASHLGNISSTSGTRVADELKANLRTGSTERRTSTRKTSIHEKTIDIIPSTSSLERARPPTDRFTSHSPPDTVPQFWKPLSKSPEDETTPTRLQAGIRRRSINRKASLRNLEERDQPIYPPQAWLRSKGSFTLDDRSYSSAPFHPCGRTGARSGTDDRDRDHYYDYPRHYPSPGSSHDYFTFYDPRADGSYQSEQRSATWRAAMMPESPPQPKRRLSESRPSFIRDPSYSKYSYVSPEDEYTSQIDDYHEKYKYPPSSAIPISRPRKHSVNDDQDWRSWGRDSPYLRRSRRDSRDNYFDYTDRDHDYRGREEREYDYDVRYRSLSYNTNAYPPRRDNHGPRSPPSSFRNEHNVRNRESRDDEGDRQKVPSGDWRPNGRRVEDGWVKVEAGILRRQSVGNFTDPDVETDYEFFAGLEEGKRREEEVAVRDLEVKKLEEKVSAEAKKLEQAATKQKEEALREKEEARLLAEQAIRKQEEATKREEEVIRKEEEARRQGEEAKEKEEEILRKEAEIRKKAEEVLIKELEAKRKEQEAKRKEQEAKRKEQEARKKEEEAKRKEEDARKKEEDAKRKESELRRKEEEARRKELEAKRKEMEVSKKEEEARRKEEEVKRKEEETRKREEEARQKEEEARQKEEAICQREEELKRREEELKRRETEISDRTEAERLQKLWDLEERDKRAALSQEWIEQERRRQTEDSRDREPESNDPERRRQPTKNAERLEQERLQQEEFRKREEQIRRQKRQDSIGAEGSWSSLPSMFPSSFPNNPSQAASHFTDRNVTSSGWNVRTPAKACSTATSPASASDQTSSSAASKPRSGSVNSIFSTASNPPTAQEEAEWRRRQEEHFAKQQEQFRKEQERISAARQQQLYDAKKVQTKEDILAIFELHNRQWVTLQEKVELRWRDIPWPMLRAPLNPDEIKLPLVRAYVENEHHPDLVKPHSPGVEIPRTIGKDKDKEIKSRLKEYMKKWHPDRFGVYLKKVMEGERQIVGDGAGSVARALGEMLSSMTQ